MNVLNGFEGTEECRDETLLVDCSVGVDFLST